MPIGFVGTVQHLAGRTNTMHERRRSRPDVLEDDSCYPRARRAGGGDCMKSRRRSRYGPETLNVGVLVEPSCSEVSSNSLVFSTPASNVMKSSDFERGLYSSAVCQAGMMPKLDVNCLIYFCVR